MSIDAKGTFSPPSAVVVLRCLIPGSGQNGAPRKYRDVKLSVDLEIDLGEIVRHYAPRAFNSKKHYVRDLRGALRVHATEIV